MSNQEVNKEINKQAQQKQDELLDDKNDVLNLNLAEGQIINTFNFKSSIMLFIFVIFCSFAVIMFIFWGILNWEDDQKETIMTKNIIEMQTINDFILIEKQRMDEVFKAQKRIDAVRSHLDSHVYRSGFFNILENNILEDVYFLDYIKKSDTSYVFSSAATCVDAAGAQVEKFLESEYVESASVEHVVVGDEENVDEKGEKENKNNDKKENAEIKDPRLEKYKVKFDLFLTFKPSIFNKKYKYKIDEKQE